MADENSLYPVLTCEIDNGSASTGGAGSPASAGGSLPNMARNAIRSALGWQYRGGDATANLRSFEAALGKAFRFREVEGHTEWDWVPQGFSIQADLGEITGAQASICRQAKMILDQTLPLLDKLESLGNATDEQDVESMRTIIRTELNEIVNELGLSGGPRVQKVDHYFALLLGALINDDGSSSVQYDPRASDSDKQPFAGHLRDLRDRLHMVESHINMVEEEVLYTDFLLLVDNVASLHQSWRAKRGAFVGGGKFYFGTLLARLARLMDVIPLAIQDLCRILDSVYIGAAQRQVIELDAEDMVLVSTETQVGKTTTKSSKILEREDLETSEFAQWLFYWDTKDDPSGSKEALDVMRSAFEYKVPVKDAAGKITAYRVAPQATMRLTNDEEETMDAVRRAFIAIRCALQTDDEFDAVVDDVLPGDEKIEVAEVGAGVDSITLDGLLQWIEHFVTIEGRQMINAGGKDGTAVFASTMQLYTDFLYSVLVHMACFKDEVDAERESETVYTKFTYYPGFHTARVFRAMRQLFTHLQAAASLAGSEGAQYIAPVYETKKGATNPIERIEPPRAVVASVPERIAGNPVTFRRLKERVPPRVAKGKIVLREVFERANLPRKPLKK